jgi:4-hydroxy-2-oxoglutarate aldolase
LCDRSREENIRGENVRRRKKMAADREVLREKLRGVFAPIVTPFKDEEISYPDLRENILKYNATDLKGYMPLGSNGEYQGLTEAESLKVLDIVERSKAPGKTIVAGCGRESAKASVEFVKKAADSGLDMAFILTPHYFASRMSDEALLRYFFAIADESPIPVVVYNAPKFAFNIVVSPELTARLSEHPNIAALKNSSLVPNIQYLEALPKGSDFHLIAGNIKTFYPGLLDGAIGGVLSTASYLPEYCSRLHRCFESGSLEEAQKLHEFLNELSNSTVGKYGVAGVKFALDRRGFYGGIPRLPLLPLTESEGKSVIDYFVTAGVGDFSA